MLDLDPRRTALVLVDVQKGVLAMPLAPYSATEIVARTAHLAESCLAAGTTVALVRVAFADDQADRLSQPTDVPMRLPPGGLPADWADLAPELDGLAAQVRITKRQQGAFHGTELDLQLRRRGVGTVVLAGIATNFGVEQTAREAYQHGYAVLIAEDACTSLGEDLHRFSIERILPRVARVRSSEEILAALAAA